ncbi:hypothetical protein NMG60_11017086 [Bertholletia excelsa]
MFKRVRPRPRFKAASLPSHLISPRVSLPPSLDSSINRTGREELGRPSMVKSKQPTEMSFEEELEDQFDCLPDAIVHLIFNKLHDAKSLCRCISVCKRFASIGSQVNTVSLVVPRKIRPTAKKSCQQITKSRSTVGRDGSKNPLRNLLHKVIAKPFQFVTNVLSLKSFCSVPQEDDCSYHSPNQILKNFKEIEFLQIELPGYGGDVESKNGDSVLKWRAEFGSELQSCVVLGSKSFHRSQENNDRDQQSDQDPLLSDYELKLRVVWTISCLIAASGRHHLMREIVTEHQMLQSLIVTDGSKQGKLCMSKAQIEELRNNLDPLGKLNSPQAPERTAVPALRVNLWYAPVLKLPSSGCVMKGATLLLIRPMEGPKKAGSDGDLVGRVLNWEENEDDKLFGDAVKEMMKKKRTCTLEMNSF